MLKLTHWCISVFNCNWGLLWFEQSRWTKITCRPDLRFPHWLRWMKRKAFRGKPLISFGVLWHSMNGTLSRSGKAEAAIVGRQRTLSGVAFRSDTFCLVVKATDSWAKSGHWKKVVYLEAETTKNLRKSTSTVTLFPIYQTPSDAIKLVLRLGHR